MTVIQAGSMVHVSLLVHIFTENLFWVIYSFTTQKYSSLWSLQQTWTANPEVLLIERWWKWNDEINWKQDFHWERKIAKTGEQEQSWCLWIVTVTCYLAKLNRSSPEWAACWNSLSFVTTWKTSHHPEQDFFKKTKQCHVSHLFASSMKVTI